MIRAPLFPSGGFGASHAVALLSFVGGHLGCLKLLPVTNSTLMNECVCAALLLLMDA